MSAKARVGQFVFKAFPMHVVINIVDIPIPSSVKNDELNKKENKLLSYINNIPTLFTALSDIIRHGAWLEL